VLYNGGLDPRKNVPVLLEGFRIAMEKDPELHLVLMGKGYDKLRDRFEALGIASNVVLTGYVSDAEKLAIMRRATALVYPSLYEGFGLPLVEAMALGAPVLTCHFGAMLEIADGAAELVDPYDVDSIRAGLLRLVQDPDHRANLRQLGLQRAADFSWDRTATQTLAAYSAAAHEIQ
jgi:glycosyltransferase involved in cell wall biosynthesis